MPSVSWQPPPVRLIRWQGNKVDLRAELGDRVAFQDGWAVVTFPGPVTFAARNGEWIVLSGAPVGVITHTQALALYPGLV
jgi:hypothetical protein